MNRGAVCLWYNGLGRKCESEADFWHCISRSEAVKCWRKKKQLVEGEHIMPQRGRGAAGCDDHCSLMNIMMPRGGIGYRQDHSYYTQSYRHELYCDKVSKT